MKRMTKLKHEYHDAVERHRLAKERYNREMEKQEKSPARQYALYRAMERAEDEVHNASNNKLFGHG